MSKVADMLSIPEMVARSYKHCHVQGLYSIPLHGKSGQGFVRLFYADETHFLGAPLPYRTEDLRWKMPLAVHSHQNDLTLEVVHGRLVNQTYRLHDYNDDREAGVLLHRFAFTSAIVNGKHNAKFERQGVDTLVAERFDNLKVGQTVFMKGHELHTVHVQPETSAGWIVREGLPTENYCNDSWSNEDLETFPFNQHYLPMTEEEVVSILQKCKLL